MNEVILLVLGALLAIGGGYIGDEIRSSSDRRRERKAIKISLCDELKGIEEIVHTIHSVWESAKVFPPSYVSDLLASTTAYDSLKTRLFLIKEDDLRTELNSFYKKLRDTVRKTEGKIGTLANTPEVIAEQNSFDTTFQALGTDAKTLREKLKP